jgi:uncharacterized protein YjiS (DUF1127 family)
MEKALTHTTRIPATRSGPWLRFARLRLWLDLWAERRALRRLDPRLLKDIGLDPETAALEASRRPWDVPPAREFHA